MTDPQVLRSKIVGQPIKVQEVRDKTLTFDGYSVGRVIDDTGALAGVYELLKPDGVTTDNTIVLKLDKKGTSGGSTLPDSPAVQEYQFIATMKSRITDFTVQAAIPGCYALVNIVVPDGTTYTGIILERIETSGRKLSQQWKVIKQSEAKYPTSIDAEKWFWEHTRTYIKLIDEMHKAHYTCNDRKPDDFYLVEMFEGDERLVVLDWNVVEKVSAESKSEHANKQYIQDVMFFARCWRNILGGHGNERHWHLQSPLDPVISIAGRAFLFNQLNPKLRNNTYLKPELRDKTGNRLLRQLEELVDLLDKSVSELKTEIEGEFGIQEQILSNKDDYIQTQLDLLPFWQRIDLLDRLDEPVDEHLQLVVETLRAAQNYAYSSLQRYIDDYSFTQRQIDILRKRTPSEIPILDVWEQALKQYDAQDHHDPDGHDAIRELYKLLRKFIYNSQSLAYELPAIKEYINRFTDRETPFYQDLVKVVEVFRTYAEGEVALVGGDIGKAKAFFLDSDKHLTSISNIYPEGVFELLPVPPKEVVDNLERIENQSLPILERLKEYDQIHNLQELAAALQAIEAVKQNDFYGALPINSLKDIWTQDYSDKVQLIFNNEISGLSEWVETLSTAATLAKMYNQMHFHTTLRQIAEKAALEFNKDDYKPDALSGLDRFYLDRALTHLNELIVYIQGEDS